MHRCRSRDRETRQPARLPASIGACNPFTWTMNELSLRLLLKGRRVTKHAALRLELRTYGIALPAARNRSEFVPQRN